MQNHKPPPSVVKQLSDKELIDQIRNSGNTALFSELYDRYANKVYRKCIAMVKHPEDAQDLTHEILVKAFLNLAGFAGNASFATWVYAITYNHCIDFIKIKQRLKISDTENERLPDVTDDSDIDEKELFEIDIQLLSSLMYQLNADDRAILLMKYQDDMSVDDIQQVLRLNSSAVKMRLKRARDRLKILFEKHQQHK
ncbi:MAG TPA: RNA polymerase sigma factor [Chitinophagales bacterium]|nr:RNA polymerase sigma factor [Chitinophagales bacterium]HRK29091.1 RNA polymerase sigma factor [Chitinophagales bacterium]